jgi:Asp-tRNA(Asn)/Glu-tRNA(Gln) amidotransferase A subunit family amidase
MTISDDPACLTASEAAAEIVACRLKPSELMAATLERAAKLDPAVKAYVHLDPEAAMTAARKLGPPGRLLHGLPVAVKDMIDTADMPTQQNSPIYQGHRPSKDAAVVAITRAQGGVIIGKTDTHEFAAGGRLPKTTNPHDEHHTAGGSSSGSAAAVASGTAALAFGTQTGGSTLRPASFCGIFGMKPTFGLVSREGAKLYSISLDTIGWYGRSVADLALMAKAQRAIRRPLQLSSSVKGKRFGIYQMPGSKRAEPEAIAALASTADQLSNAGASVIELTLPREFSNLAKMQLTIMKGEGRTAFLDDYLQHYDLLAQDFRDRVEDADNISFIDLRTAQDHVAQCRATFDKLTIEFSAIIAIGAPGEAPRDLTTTGDAFFQRMWTVLQVPTVGLPGFSGARGMPIGVQLICPRYEDAALLETAHAVSHAIETPRVSPVPI